MLMVKINDTLLPKLESMCIKMGSELLYILINQSGISFKLGAKYYFFRVEG